MITTLSDQEILDHISQTSEMREHEKDKFGEVFTPSILINELLDNLPKSIWKNPTLKWIDPATGRGNFPALVYIRLLNGLENKIPNIQERKRHILDKMLYMVELNQDNVQELRKLFGKTANISQSNFLDETDKRTKDLGGQNTFDVVMGNPPFQTTKVSKYNGSSGNRTLWDKFLVMILTNILKPKGYLAFITPANWRRPDHSLYSLVTKDNTLEYLHIYGKKDGSRLFNAQTRFDLYIVQEGTSNNNHKTRIIDEKGIKQELNLQSWPFIPNYAFHKIQQILVSEGTGIPIIFSAGDYDARKLSKTKTRSNKYPVVHNITRKGLGIQYAKERKESQFGVPKVLLNFNERQYPYNDYKGEYGMSQLTFGIPIKSKTEGEQWITAINSANFEEIVSATKWGAFQTDYRMFKYFNPKLYNKKGYRKTKKNRGN